MNRESVLLAFYREGVRGLRIEAEGLIASPAKYLDADLSIEPTSGILLSDRVQRLRTDFTRDFPSRAADLPEMKYRPTQDQTLARSDLVALVKDLERFAELVPEVGVGSTADDDSVPGNRW